jgi:hypothetical protein
MPRSRTDSSAATGTFTAVSFADAGDAVVRF